MYKISIPTSALGRTEYWLHHPRSVADLEAMGEDLVAGVRVTLDPGTGEPLKAWLHFHAEVNCWIAYPEPNQAP